MKEIIRRIPEETRKKLTAKGHIPQEGYILECLPVPPNCLSVPDVSDGVSSMSVVSQLKLNSYVEFIEWFGLCLESNPCIYVVLISRILPELS